MDLRQGSHFSVPVQVCFSACFPMAFPTTNGELNGRSAEPASVQPPGSVRLPTARGLAILPKPQLDGLTVGNSLAGPVQ